MPPAAAARTASVTSASCHEFFEPAGTTTYPATEESPGRSTGAGTVRNSSGSEFQVSVASFQSASRMTRKKTGHTTPSVEPHCVT